MGNKIITLDTHFPTGEPTVQLVATWGKNSRVLRETTSLHKTAAHSPAEDYIRTITPEPGKSVVLVIGLGDHETYGPNRNGDGFPSDAIKGKITSDEVLPKHYKSYEKAHVFEHHVNHDPAKAIGRVKKAFWNPHMRRVEVIEDFSHDLAPHLLEKIAAGEYPAKSMGCRIKYDVCTSCGNKARTRAEYCDHLKYAMSQIDPHTGIQNAALNPSPDFFDSSWVIRPADRTGFMLKKVAYDAPYEIKMGSYELADAVNDLSSKAAALRKAADIEKVLQGEPVASLSSLKPSEAELIKKYQDVKAKSPKDQSKVVNIMITYKPSEAVGTTDSMDIPLGIKNLIKYFLNKMDPSFNNEDESTMDDVCKTSSDHASLIFETFARYPRFFDEVTKLASLDETSVNGELVEKLAMFEKNLFADPSSPTTFGSLGALGNVYNYATGYRPQTLEDDYFYRATTPVSWRYDERPLTDVLVHTDPNTGRKYVTNYKAVQRANDELVARGRVRRALTAAPLIGAGAVLGTAALGLGLAKRFNMLKKLSPNVVRGLGVGGAGLGAAGLYTAFSPVKTQGPTIKTDTGETISAYTEMVPRDSYEKTGEMYYVDNRIIDGKTVKLANNVVDNYWNSIKSAEVYDDKSAELGCTLDFDKVANILGMSILRLTA